MHDNKWNNKSVRQRKTTFSKSAGLKVYPHRNMIHVLSAWYKNAQALVTCCMHHNSNHSSKLNVSNNSTSPQQFKTNPIRHIHWQLLSLGSAVILSTAQLRKTVVSIVESVFFPKAISNHQLSAVNYSFHGERLVFAQRRINTTRLSILSYFIGRMQRWSWIPEDVFWELCCYSRTDVRQSEGQLNISKHEGLRALYLLKADFDCNSKIMGWCKSINGRIKKYKY